MISISFSRSVEFFFVRMCRLTTRIPCRTFTGIHWNPGKVMLFLWYIWSEDEINQWLSITLPKFNSEFTSLPLKNDGTGRPAFPFGVSETFEGICSTLGGYILGMSSSQKPCTRRNSLNKQDTPTKQVAFEQWKKGPGTLFRVYRGWNTTQLYRGLFHKPWNKDPY